MKKLSSGWRWVAVGMGLVFLVVLFATTAVYAGDEWLRAAKIEATNVKAGTLFLLGIALLLLFLVPPKYLIPTFMVAVCFIPPDQRFIIAGLDFSTLRILALFIVFRLVFFGRVRKITWSRLDHLLFLGFITTTVVGSLRSQTFEFIVSSCGYFMDTLLVYWVFRQTLYSRENIYHVIAALAFCALVTVPFVAYEWITGTNPFSALGRSATSFRAGKIRCSASFPHPIVMGTFYGLLVPFFLMMKKIKKRNFLYWGSILACVFLAFASNSSTCVGVLAIVILLPLGVRFRRYFRQGVLWLVILLTILHFVMMVRSGKPVWFLLMRINFTGSSTSWYRFWLFDTFLKRFGEWWLLGTKTTVGWDQWGLLADVTNQYVVAGIHGGLWGLLLFLATLGTAFYGLARELLVTKDQHDHALAWYLMIIFVGILAAFFGLSFFGQLSTFWYLHFAMIAYLCEKREIEKRSLKHQQTTGNGPVCL